jgi:hypothetical protein
MEELTRRSMLARCSHTGLQGPARSKCIATSHLSQSSRSFVGEKRPARRRPTSVEGNRGMEEVHYPRRGCGSTPVHLRWLELVDLISALNRAATHRHPSSQVAWAHWSVVFPNYDDKIQSGGGYEANDAAVQWGRLFAHKRKQVRQGVSPPLSCMLAFYMRFCDKQCKTFSPILNSYEIFEVRKYNFGSLFRLQGSSGFRNYNKI